MLHYLTLTLNAAFLHILLHYVWLHLVDSMSTRWRTKEKGQQPFSHDVVVLVSRRANDGELWIRDHHVVGGGTEHDNGVSRRRVEETTTESQRGFLQGWTDESEHCLWVWVRTTGQKGRGKSAVEPEIGSVRRASRVKREEHRNAAECKTYEKAHQILVNAVYNKCSSTKCINNAWTPECTCILVTSILMHY